MRKVSSDKIHDQIQQKLEAVSYEEWQQWRTSRCTQALLLMLERDNMDLQMGWSLGNYADTDNHRAAGQSFYILSLQEDINQMKAKEEEVDA